MTEKHSRIQRKRLSGAVEIAKLRPFDLDDPSDGQIERILLFETGSDDIALSIITSTGTMTLELSPRDLRRFAQKALRVAGGAKEHLDVA